MEKLVSVGTPEGIATLEQWNRASTITLYAVLDVGIFCNMTEEDVRDLNATDALLKAVGSHMEGTAVRLVVVIFIKLMEFIGSCCCTNCLFAVVINRFLQILYIFT